MPQPKSTATITVTFAANDAGTTTVGTITITQGQFQLGSIFNLVGKAGVDALKNAMLLTDAGTLAGGNWI